MKHKELSEKIIGCAYRVYNKMGFGFLESVYEKCLIIELRKAGLHASAQKEITVYYENEIVGEFIADVIVEIRWFLSLNQSGVLLKLMKSSW